MDHTTGCRCASCWTLAEYMNNLTGRDYGLPPAPGHASRARLRVVTAGPPTDTTCDGSMTCPCPTCVGQRAALSQQAGQGSGPRQPWEPRPARRAA